MQERRNSIANALELRLSCINLSYRNYIRDLTVIWSFMQHFSDWTTVWCCYNAVNLFCYQAVCGEPVAVYGANLQTSWGGCPGNTVHRDDQDLSRPYGLHHRHGYQGEENCWFLGTLEFAPLTEFNVKWIWNDNFCQHILCFSCEIALGWIVNNLESTLVHIMAWYHQATSHFMS